MKRIVFGIFGLCLLMALCGCQMLGWQKVTYYKGLRIREDLLDRNSYNNKYKYGNPMPRVEYITIHNTANVGPAVNERTYLNNRRDNVYISFHFAVDEREAIQILPYDVNGWHAGDGQGKGNRASIGVEICRSQCRGPAGWQYRHSEENAEILAAALLRHFRLTAEELRMHQDWSGKYCPHRLLEEKRFERFRSRVAARLAAEPDSEESAVLSGIDGK